MKNNYLSYNLIYFSGLFLLGAILSVLFPLNLQAQTIITDSSNKDTVNIQSLKKAEPIVKKSSSNQGLKEAVPLALKPKGPFVPSPRKAGLLSAVFPGAGQIYNRKWWKVPIVYAGFGTLGYFFVDNNNNFVKFRDAYINRVKGDRTDLSLINEFPIADQLSIRRDFWRRNRDLTVILTAIFYAVTIVDATVDAHFYTFNITDDLDVTLAPQMQGVGFSSLDNSKAYSAGFQAGLQLNFTFK